MVIGLIQTGLSFNVLYSEMEKSKGFFYKTRVDDVYLQAYIGERLRVNKAVYLLIILVVTSLVFYLIVSGSILDALMGQISRESVISGAYIYIRITSLVGMCAGLLLIAIEYISFYLEKLNEV